MKADNLSLQGILNSPNRYLIPVFQRYYSWGKREWAQLWEDVLELWEGDSAAPRTHFLGALVFIPASAEANRPTFMVIDGQQRLLTLSLVLCAIRNSARSHSAAELAAEITDTYLVHPYGKEAAHFRLYPRQRDREEYLAVVQHRPFKGVRGQITQALRYFVEQLESLFPTPSEPDLRQLFHLLATQLEFVYITLDEENPYRIFKSLNSTGMTLSEADLIRNFMLMEASRDPAVQDAFDDAEWRPLEQQFEDDQGQLNSRDLSAFFRDFLMMDGRYIPLSATFYHFERRYQAAHLDVRALTAELRTHAQHYNMIRGRVPHPDKRINRALHKLRSLPNTAVYPLLLHLLGRWADGQLATAEVERVVTAVLDFTRQLLARPELPRGYGRWLIAACRLVGESEKRPSEAVGAFLSHKL